MLAAIIGLLSGAWRNVALAAAAIVAVLTALALMKRGAYNQGVSDARVKSQADVIRAVNERAKIDAGVGRLSGDAARQRLRDRWGRG